MLDKIKINNMDKELVRHFIEECKEDKEWHDRWKANHIEFDNYFKYSGEIEEDTPVYQFESQRSVRFVYDTNNKCHTLHEIRIRKKEKENENINTI
jgi:hypothetical protein|tara:strand:- start:329 stop:616 length:288 start_codon:yes stop_codon:yes gene_type:complete